MSAPPEPAPPAGEPAEETRHDAELAGERLLADAAPDVDASAVGERPWVALPAQEHGGAAASAGPGMAQAESPSAAAPPPGDAVAAAPAEASPPGQPPGEEPAGEASPPGPDPADIEQALRLAEALVYASDRPVTPARLQPVLPEGCEARAVLLELAARCAERPVRLVEVAGGFAFRTAEDLAPALTRVVEVPRRLPRAAMETLAIIAYHQPVTRAEVEEIRGASLAQTTLEALLEMGLVAPRGRKEVPGRPTLWATTPRFLEQFGLKALSDLPRREELVNEPTLPLGIPGAPPLPPPPG